MATIACVTAVTPDLVTVENDGNGVHIKVDGVGIFLDGNTQTEQLHQLAMIAGKLLNAHDAIAAQQRLFGPQS